MNLCIAIAAYALWGILVVIALNFSTTKDDPPRFSDHERLFMELFVVALLLFRLPYLTHNFQLNGDEGQMLAQGMKYLTDPIPWRSVDGTTNGPLDSYALMWPAPFNMPLNYCSARITGVVLLALSVFCSQRLFRLALGPKWSLILIMPMVTLYLFAFESDFVHYSSELVPVALLNALSWAGFALYKNPSKSSAVAAGLIAGAVPLAKIQAFPIAFACFVLTLGALLSHPQKDRQWRDALLSLILCAFAVPLLILLPVLISGAWPDFWIRYILSNAAYHAPLDHSRLQTLVNLLFFPPERGPLKFGISAPQTAASLTGLVLCALIAFITHWGLGTKSRLPRGYPWLLFGSVLLVVAGLFSVLKSNFAFPHYLQLLVLPFSAFTTVALIPIESAIQSARNARTLRGMAAAMVAAICLLPPLAANACNGFPILAELNFPWVFPDDPVVDLLKQDKIPGDRLAVWGWHPELYVYTGMIPATRDALSYMLFLDGPSSAYYKRTFVEDMKRTCPRYFVDTSGEDSLSNDTPATKEWPPFDKITSEKAPFISEYLKQEYTAYRTYKNGIGHPLIVIYRRNDSFPQISNPGELETPGVNPAR